MSDDRHTPRTYEVRHRTDYRYAEDVTASYGRARLGLRETESQHVRSTRVEVTPSAGVVTQRLDYFGNVSHYFEILDRHTTLAVESVSRVQVDRPAVDVTALDNWTVASAARALAREHDPVTVSLYRLPSHLVPLTDAVRAYADGILASNRSLGDALVALTHTIFEGFSYEQGATDVTTPLDELLQVGAGVCQDFAHLAVACLRHVGLPARYVSGYLETLPPPGKHKLQGSDASHAWCSVLTPGGRWVDLDPTNDHFTDSRYVVTAWGRDYKDVSPMKGVIFTEGRESTLHVAVDVTRVT